jgi:hypothetical protein
MGDRLGRRIGGERLDHSRSRRTTTRDVPQPFNADRKSNTTTGLFGESIRQVCDARRVDNSDEVQVDAPGVEILQQAHPVA